MALPIGKLTILVGAGILGSVIAKEGNVSDFFSGALKIAWKQIRRTDTAPSAAKPQNDSLLAQVNSLRQELQILASNRSVTIVTANGTGATRYGVVVVVVVVGYGYAWWKGWKLPDMMFATKRGLSDACNSIAKQLENVYASISATKRHLSSRIDRVDCNLDECAELTAATKEEVSNLRGDMKMIGVDVQSVHHAVRTLETKISRIEGKQDLTNEGVRRLVVYARDLEDNKMTERIQGSPATSSRPALEPPESPSRAGSSLPFLSLEPPSPSASNGSDKVQRPLQNAVSAPGLKELQGISEVSGALNSPEASNGICMSEERLMNNGSSSTSGLFGGMKCSSFNASFITRTRSATHSFK